MTSVRLRALRWSAWTAVLLLGAAQGWYFRHKVSPDGVAYLDLSDAIVHGHVHDLVNGYWSPLYPVVVGFLRICVSWTPLSAPYWEFLLLHVAAFTGLAASLAAFEFLLRALGRAGEKWNRQPLNDPMNRGMAYALFAVAALVMISVEGTVPDFFLTASVFCAFALAIDFIESLDIRCAALLGLTLALGALSKSFMFPLSAVLLVTLAWIVRRRGKEAWRAMVVAAAVFGVATLPWCIALSKSLGKPTFGETGALNFAWYVNGQQPANTGVMPRRASPTDLPIDGVGVFSPARGTNPWWFDPAYWNRDIRPRLSLDQQWVRLTNGLQYYAGVFPAVIALLIAAAVGVGWSSARQIISRTAVVLVPSVAAFAAYALVYTTSRYVAPFLVAGCVALAVGLPTGSRISVSRFFIAITAALLVLDAVSELRGRIFMAYAAAFFALAFLSSSRFDGFRRWMISLTSAAAALLVLVMLPSVGARLLVLGIGVGGWIWFSKREPLADRGQLQAVAVAALLSLLVPNAIAAWYAMQRWAETSQGVVHPDWATANQLMREGIAPGSRIAVVGDATDVGWARLARYQIVGIVPPHRVAAFAGLSDAQRRQVLAAFARAGAAHVVMRPAK